MIYLLRAWMRLGLGIAALSVAAVAFAACGGESAPPDQQRLVIQLDGDPSTLDPHLADFAVSAAIVKNISATLLRYDPVEDALQPYVAREVPSQESGGISQDGLTYTFHLRDEAVWEDGRPITADDFVYSLRRLVDPRLGSYYGLAFYAWAVEGGPGLMEVDPEDADAVDAALDKLAVRALDDKTLEVRLTQPSATFNFLMSLWPTSAVRQDVVERYGDVTNTAWTEPGRLVSAGPFRLAEWQPGDHLTLEANPNFWLDELRPKLESIRFQIIEDEHTAYLAYLAGDLDVVQLPLANLRLAQEDAELSIQLHRVSRAATASIDINQRAAPFDDRKVRLAFAKAIDRQTFVNEIRQGRGRPATGWYPPTLVSVFEPRRGAELAFDPAGAAQLLTAAGYDGGDGFPTVSLTFANVGPNALQAQFLQQQWKEHLGVDVELVALDPAAFQDAYNSGDFQMALSGWIEDYNHPENWMTIWMSGANTIGYASEEFDALVLAAKQELDPGKAAELWRHAEELLIDTDVAVVPILYDENLLLVKPYVRDFVLTGVDGWPGDFFYWMTFIDGPGERAVSAP